MDIMTFMRKLPKTFSKRLAANGSTFSAFYNYFCDDLFAKYMQVFVYGGAMNEDLITFTTELEKIYCLNGDALIASIDGKPVAYFGEMCGGVTEYFDLYAEYSFYSPKRSGVVDISDNIIGFNDRLRRPFFSVINHYAILLSHLEVSMINTLINMRESGGTFVGLDAPEVNAIIKYRNDLCNGKVGAIQDPSMLGVKRLEPLKSTGMSLGEFMETRQNLIADFYATLGVKTARTKKSNMISDEINANDTMLSFNIDDMLDCRKRTIERINKSFGLNLTVDINPILKIDVESMQKGGEENVV